MSTYNQGIVNVGDPGSAASGYHTRRLFNFADRVADLAPDESPFFVYLSKVAKVPTDDPIFRFLEDRTKVSMTDRSFQLAADVTIPAQGSNETYTIDDGAGGSIDWLIRGMVVVIGQEASNAPDPVMVRVEADPVIGGSSTSFIGKTLSGDDGGVSIDNAKCTVIGTSFSEGSGSPSVFSEELDNSFGYTQIFKTACEMSNTARATQYRGYADEFQRIWNNKLREHKVDIERAMLFGNKQSVSGVQYSDGIVGHILNASAPTTGSDDLAYSAGSPYYRSATTSELTYDRILEDFEVLYDPARGSSSAKLGLASLPLMTYFNKMGSNGFLDGSMASELQYQIEKSQGSFGHQVLSIQTIHGELNLVKEPLFRGFASGFLACVDLDNVSYRPLVGNGVNRDTQIMTNVQAADEDLRKDMILTEAGLEVSLPESHMLIHLQGV